MKTIWSDLGNVPINVNVLASIYSERKYVRNKISSLEDEGKIIRLKRGLYVASPEFSDKRLSINLIANHLYGPSYVSCQSALAYYGLIPERVYGVTSMTMKHRRKFTNSLGTFDYIRCEQDVFAIGLDMQRESDVSFVIATPEKALCDLIATTPGLNLRYTNEILTWLEDDIRFDMDEFFKLNVSILEEYAKVGKKSTMITKLIKIIQR